MCLESISESILISLVTVLPLVEECRDCNSCIGYCIGLMTISQLSTELNGGAVLSSILYCVYVDDLLQILSKAGVGCFIGLHFVGACTCIRGWPRSIGTHRFCDAYKLLAICEDYVREHSISFNALKSKCLVALPNNTFKKLNDYIFYIDGCLTLFSRFLILAMWSHQIRMTAKITIRKHSFIGKVNNTLCYFGKLSSFVKYN